MEDAKLFESKIKANFVAKSMKKITPIFFLLFVSLIIGEVYAQGIQIPDPKGRYVIDDAQILKQSTVQYLQSKLRQHEDSNSNQVVVYIIPSLQGEVLEPFTNRVFNTWNIGQKGRNNGVLLLVAMKEKRIRIEPGYGLEGALPDALCARIIDYEISPEFKRGDYDRGIINGVESILLAIEGEYDPIARGHSDQMSPGIVLLIFFLIVVFIIFGSKGKGSSLPGSSTRPMWYGGPMMMGRGGRGGFGGGGFGGFTGGGGFSGGGGASGGW